MELRIRGAAGDSTIRFGALEELGVPAPSVVVTDPRLEAVLGTRLPPVPRALVPPGEAAKSLASLEALWNRFFELGIGRDGLVAAVGGGSVSDLAGFAAATWLRGVSLAFAPTTLLAMVDASVGGKNGIDFGGRKNLLGTFAQPGLVVCDVTALASLPDADFSCGMAEAAKHALIEGGAHWDFLIRECGSRAGLDRSRLERAVELSLSLKSRIVSGDEREDGSRRLLNLGHTYGHSLELVAGIPHGQAVAAGLATAVRLAVARGEAGPLLGGPDMGGLLGFFSGWGLPSSIREALAAGGRADVPATRAAVADAIAADKKRRGSEILFALPRSPGDVRIAPIGLAGLRDFAMEAP